MELTIVGPQQKYAPATFIDPPSYGYIHVAATVAPPAGRAPFVRKNPQRAALLARAKILAARLADLDTVTRATVYRAVLAPPAEAKVAVPPRFDVVILIETTSPQVIEEVQRTEQYRLLLEAVTGAAEDVRVMAARCIRCVADVDKSRPGLFLFNHFVADDAEVALRLWESLAGWYTAETGLDNSTLLEPVGDDADYIFVNHARWDYGLAALLWHQLSKRTFRTVVLAGLRANRTTAMPVLYRLA
jgi:hypothetical protein